MEKLLPLRQLESVVGFRKSKIYRLIESGEFPPPIKIGRSSRIPTSITCRRNIAGLMVGCMENSTQWVQSVDESLPRIQTSKIPRSAEFRRLYVLADGKVFVICDYSQIELRVCAELSGETRMIEAMKQGEDLHRMTAAKIFGVSEEEVTKEQRQQAKAVNFGLIYGMSPNRLVKDGIAKDQKQGAAIIKAFFELYPNIKRMHKYLEQQMKQAIQKDPTQLQIRTQGTNRRRWLSRKGCQFQRWRPTSQHALQSTCAGIGSRWYEGSPSGPAEQRLEE